MNYVNRQKSRPTDFPSWGVTRGQITGRRQAARIAFLFCMGICLGLLLTVSAHRPATAQLLVAYCVAHLQIKHKMMIQFFIRPTETGFQNLQSHQYVYWYVGAGSLTRIEYLKGPFIQSAEHFPVEDTRPRRFQHLAYTRRQVIQRTDQAALLMGGILSKHGAFFLYSKLTVLITLIVLIPQYFASLTQPTFSQ
ncbi:MAG: hypothetical protein M9896_19050 [Candidatus Promineofilum sp.]|uniref:hypothetical protein n=1 Tax=Promineifilum sp. TaxID=2664178 RepID=UPI002411B341|nr:hypothetical protein [Promineifilum sp.]